MRRSLLVLLATLALLAPFALAAPGPRSPTGEVNAGTSEKNESDRDGSEHADESAAQNERESSDRRDKGVGSFSLSAASETVNGDFVDFTYNQTGIQAFTVGGRNVLDLTVVGRSHEEDNEGVVAKGAEVRVKTASFELHVHDNPQAVTKLATDGIVTIHFAPGTNLSAPEDGTIDFTLGNLTGTLRAEDARTSGATVVVREGFLLFVEAPRGDFDIHRRDIGDAIAKKHVGVEGSFNQKSDGHVQDDVVSYGNVTMRTMKAEHGNLTVQVEGHGFDGRVIVLDVEGRVLGALKSDDLHVTLDNLTVDRAENITDVLDPDNDGLHAEYYVVFDPTKETFQILVSVPHYSIHTLSVTTILEAATPSVIAGVLVGVLVLGASGFVLFKRR